MFPAYVRLRRDGVTTAGHRDHRDRDRDARGCGTPSLAPTCRACGFLHGQRCAESRSVVSGTAFCHGWLRGQREQDPQPKTPARTLPRATWAQRDRPGRQTHVTRGAKFPGAPSDHKHPCEASAFTYRAAPTNHALNVALPSRPRPNRSTPYPAKARLPPPPPSRSTRISPGALVSRRAERPGRRRGAAASGVAAHNVTSEKTARQKGRAAALPERAREQNFQRANNTRTQASPKLFTSLCARKRAQNINSRAPATHRT